MTLWRWTRDPRIRFPPPDVVINGRKYWKRKTLRQHRQRILSELGGQAPEREPKATRARGVES